MCHFFKNFWIRRRRRKEKHADLERGAVLGDLHVELVRDAGSAVLQGDQAEVSQAGSVGRMPGCHQNH